MYLVHYSHIISIILFCFRSELSRTLPRPIRNMGEGSGRIYRGKLKVKICFFRVSALFPELKRKSAEISRKNGIFSGKSNNLSFTRWLFGKYWTRLLLPRFLLLEVKLPYVPVYQSVGGLVGLPFWLSLFPIGALVS